MSKPALRKKISNLLDNVPDGDVIEIYYTNPVTGETKLMYQSPAAKAKQESHEQNTPEATDR